MASLSETKSPHPRFSCLLRKKYSQRRKLSCGLVTAQDVDVFLFDRRIRPSRGPVKHAGTEHHLRSPEELISFERGLRIMRVSRDICSAQHRRNKPINRWNVEYLGELQGHGKAKRSSRVGPCVDRTQLLTLNLVRTKASLVASDGSGSSSQILRILIFFPEWVHPSLN